MDATSRSVPQHRESLARDEAAPIDAFTVTPEINPSDPIPAA
jgi:hypothetical protein